MPTYNEFYVRGSGHEMAQNSSRDRPQIMLDTPLKFYKYNVKTVEIPLTFSMQVDPSTYVFTTTYLLTNSQKTVSFRDTIVFSDYEIVTGALLLSKMQTLFVYHASLTFAGHAAATPYFVNTGADGIAKLGAAPTVVLGTTGIPQFTFTQALAVNGAAPVDVSVQKVTIDLQFQSLLAELFDFTYYVTPTIVVQTVSGLTLVSLDSQLQSMVTRPAYLLLHSNLRSGFAFGSTGRPDGSSYDTIIAKIEVNMDNTQDWGLTSQVWKNPSQHPDLFYTADTREYSELFFWMTYPNGNKARFSGKSFSLTLAGLLLD